MLVIYDLDKTSLYCPIADFLDKFIPKNEELKKYYYRLYPIAHRLEILLGLLQINEDMYYRACNYDKAPDTSQFVVTARHYTPLVHEHIKRVFKDLEPKIDVICVAQGITNMSKAEAIEKYVIYALDEEVIMYDDNFKELKKMSNLFKGKFTGIQVLFKNNKEFTRYVY